MGSPLARTGTVSGVVGMWFQEEVELIRSDYMPCTQQLALTFTIAGQDYPVHPLDMSWQAPGDESQSKCIGALQYSSNLGDTGDL
jgi:hypothetical protein